MWINYSNYYTLDPLPDELFYSTVSRTAQFLNNKHLNKAADHYFNTHSRRAASVIPVNYFEDPIVIFNHTIAPYYIASFGLERQKNILDNIFFFNDSGFTGKFKTGANGSVFKKINLFYCPTCLKEDLEKFGCPYFHLSHQYEGINACAKHGVKLLEFIPSNVKIFPLLSLEDYQKPQPAGLRDIIYSKWALEFRNFSHEYLSMVYQSKILERNIYLLNKRRFYLELENFFGYDFLNQCNCSKEKISHSNQKILNLLNPQGRSTHPYYHFMMWEFLGLTPESFTGSIFGLKGKKLIPFPKPKDSSGLKLIKEDLGKRSYFSKNYGREIIEYFPIDISKYKI